MAGERHGRGMLYVNRPIRLAPRDMCESDDKCIRDFAGRLQGNMPAGDLTVDVKIISKWILERR